MTDQPDAVAGWLWLIAGQATVWLAAGLLAGRRLADRPAVAHLALGLCLVAAGLTPLLSGLAAVKGWGLLPGPGSSSRFRADAPGGNPPDPAPSWESADLLAAGWAAVSLLLLARLALAVRVSRHLVRSARAEDGMELHACLAAARGRNDRSPHLRRHPRVKAPMLWGWGRPVVLLPPGPFPAGPEAEAVFRHELAHLRRGDPAWLLVAEVAAACLFWHPLAWVVKRRLALYAEFACDDAVVAGGVPAPHYAAALLGLAAGGRPPVAALSATGQLARRLRRLLRPGQCPRPDCPRVDSITLAVLVAAAAAGMALARPHSNPAEERRLRQPLEPQAVAAQADLHRVAAAPPAPRKMVRAASGVNRPPRSAPSFSSARKVVWPPAQVIPPPRVVGSP